MFAQKSDLFVRLFELEIMICANKTLLLHFKILFWHSMCCWYTILFFLSVLDILFLKIVWWILFNDVENIVWIYEITRVGFVRTTKIFYYCFCCFVFCLLFLKAQRLMYSLGCYFKFLQTMIYILIFNWKQRSHTFCLLITIWGYNRFTEGTFFLAGNQTCV